MRMGQGDGEETRREGSVRHKHTHTLSVTLSLPASLIINQVNPTGSPDDCGTEQVVVDLSMRNV